MAEDLISVIIPVYNTESYISRAVESVLDGGYQKIEVICIDDGSTDLSLKILNRLADSDARVRIISKENGGVSSARNCGMDAAKGDWICFLDSDDWVEKDYIQTLYASVKEHNADIAISGRVEVYEGASVPERMTDTSESLCMSLSEASTRGLFRSYVTGRLYNKTVVESIRFPLNVHLAEDQIFNSMIAACGKEWKICLVDKCRYFYYMRDDSLVHSCSNRAYYDVCRWYLEHLDLFHQKGYVIQQAFRSILNYRYRARVCGEGKTAQKDAREMIKTCLHHLWREQSISVKNKMLFTVASISPSLYRTSLIIKDRTVLDWEKLVKEQISAKET